MGGTSTFASTYGRWLTGAAAAAAVVALISVAVVDGVAESLTLVPLFGLVVLLVWALFWNPAVEVSDGEIVVRNVLATVRIPWPAYRGITVRYSLVVHTTGADVTAWAAPPATSLKCCFGMRAYGCLAFQPSKILSSAERVAAVSKSPTTATSPCAPRKSL